MISFVVLTYIPLSVAMVGSIVISGIRNNHPGSAPHRWMERVRDGIPTEARSSAMRAYLCLQLVICGLSYEQERLKSNWQTRYRAMSRAATGPLAKWLQ